MLFRSASVHLAKFPERQETFYDNDVMSRWDDQLMPIRTSVLKVLETVRAKETIGNALEAKVYIAANGDIGKLLTAYEPRLADIFIVSQVELGQPPSGAEIMEFETPSPHTVGVIRAEGKKCGRCWKWLPSVGQDPKHPEICQHCTESLVS